MLIEQPSNQNNYYFNGRREAPILPSNWEYDLILLELLRFVFQCLLSSASFQLVINSFRFIGFPQNQVDFLSN